MSDRSCQNDYFTFMSDMETESGIAVAELALFVVVLMSVCLVGIEFSRATSYRHGASSISREAASQALRNCIGMYKYETESSESQWAVVRACLANVGQTVERFARTKFPGSEVIVSLYRYEGNRASCANDPSGVMVRLDSADGGQGAPRTYSSRFIIENGRSRGQFIHGGLSKQVLCSNRAMIFAEVFIPYGVVSSQLSPRFFWNPREFYNVSVM